MTGGRYDLTEEESIALLEIRNQFYEEFSVAFVRAILKCPSPDLVNLLYEQLMENASAPKYMDMSWEEDSKGRWVYSIPSEKDPVQLMELLLKALAKLSDNIDWHQPSLIPPETLKVLDEATEKSRVYIKKAKGTK